MTTGSVRFVKDLSLKRRLIRDLGYGNIHYVSDLISSTEEDLLSIYGIGRKSLNGIKNALGRYGLSLLDRKYSME